MSKRRLSLKKHRCGGRDRNKNKLIKNLKVCLRQRLNWKEWRKTSRDRNWEFDDPGPFEKSL